MLEYSINGEKMHIELGHILMIESFDHKVEITTVEKRKIVFYNKIGHLEKQLKERGFVRIHKSYLVNLKYVTDIKYDEVVLMKDTKAIKLPFGRKYRTKLSRNADFGGLR